MHMGVDHVRDAHAFAVSEAQVVVDVLFMSIDDGTLAEAPAAEQVRGAAGVEVVVRFEDHRLPQTATVSTGKPAAFHSGKPAARRRARRPLPRRISTARSA